MYLRALSKRGQKPQNQVQRCTGVQNQTVERGGAQKSGEIEHHRVASNIQEGLMELVEQWVSRIDWILCEYGLDQDMQIYPIQLQLGHIVWESQTIQYRNFMSLTKQNSAIKT